MRDAKIESSAAHRLRIGKRSVLTKIVPEAKRQSGQQQATAPTSMVRHVIVSVRIEIRHLLRVRLFLFDQTRDGRPAIGLDKCKRLQRCVKRSERANALQLSAEANCDGLSGRSVS